ncbi:MAG TPA: hypothetical protein VM737_11385 [Gemmatimonadota bacterium]|nr:hypothetical protein [Gemmatimonadota bacterium]
MDTPLKVKSLSPWTPVTLLGLLLAAPLAGQTPDHPEAPSRPDARTVGFEREYLDASAYRSQRVLLRDWPALTSLVRWSGRLEAALAEEDATFSAELLAEFRARVDSLAKRPLPDFLEPEAEGVRGHFTAIDTILDRAEASLGTLPAPAIAAGETPNAPERRRTLVTGRTAVTVPAGVRVGSADSLPTAELLEQELNFTDYVALALTELDGLVHLVRDVGREAGEEDAGEAPDAGLAPTDRRAGEAPNRPPGTEPDRPER